MQQAQAGIELESGAHANATAADVEPPSPPSPPPNPPSSRSASAPVRGNDGRSKALKARVEASQVEHAPVPGIKPMSLIKIASPSTQGTVVFQRQSHRTCDQPALFEFGTGFLPPETDAQKRRWRRYFQAETRDWRPRRARNGRKNGLSASELSVAGFGRLGGWRTLADVLCGAGHVRSTLRSGRANRHSASGPKSDIDSITIRPLRWPGS